MKLPSLRPKNAPRRSTRAARTGMPRCVYTDWHATAHPPRDFSDPYPYPYPYPYYPYPYPYYP